MIYHITYSLYCPNIETIVLDRYNNLVYYPRKANEFHPKDKGIWKIKKHNVNNKLNINGK